jgi:hypothetical protein
VLEEDDCVGSQPARRDLWSRGRESPILTVKPDPQLISDEEIVKARKMMRSSRKKD